MKRHILTAVALSLLMLIPPYSEARDLVITLKDGSRISYPLSAKETVKMIPGENAFTLNGESYQVDNIKELRIFKQAPADAIPVGLIDIKAAIQTDDSQGIHDLSGRKVAESASPSHFQQLKPGIYIIHKQKVVKH